MNAVRSARRLADAVPAADLPPGGCWGPTAPALHRAWPAACGDGPDAYAARLLGEPRRTPSPGPAERPSWPFPRSGALASAQRAAAIGHADLSPWTYASGGAADLSGRLASEIWAMRAWRGPGDPPQAWASREGVPRRRPTRRALSQTNLGAARRQPSGRGSGGREWSCLMLLWRFHGSWRTGCRILWRKATSVPRPRHWLTRTHPGGAMKA